MIASSRAEYRHDAEPRRCSPFGLFRPNSSERVANVRRRSIVRGELTPGEHVRQEIWASRLGVSRVPVREALKMLAAEHLLVHDPHRGYFVADVRPYDKEQIYRIRQFLEPEIVRSIRWPSEDEIENLRTSPRAPERAMLKHDVAEGLSEGQRLYFAIYDLLASEHDGARNEEVLVTRRPLPHRLRQHPARAGSQV